MRFIVPFLVVAPIAVACTGSIAGSGGDPSKRPTSGGAEGTAHAGGSGGVIGTMGGRNPGPTPVDPSARYAPGGVYRLTARQYANALRDLIGGSVPVPALRQDVAIAGFTTVGAGVAGVNEDAAESFEKGALDAAAAAFGNGGTLRPTVTCAAASGPDEACARKTLRALGRKIFRRALAADEESPYVDVWRAAKGIAGSDWKGFEMAVAAMLQSPKFLFRFEEGEPDPADATRRRYAPYELASRLAFFLWSSTPDDALLDAAEAGALATTDGLATQVTRMLTSPKAKTGLLSFIDEKLELGKAALIAKDASTFPQFSPSLAAAMRTETLKVVEAVVVDGERDFLELLDTRTTFVDGALAKLYGIPGVTGDAFTKVTMPSDWNRLGILGQASFLATRSHVVKTSPTQRGKFVAERLLCQSIPPPDPNANTNLPDVQGQTLREVLENHRKNPSCAACHALMDPIGVAFENFDAVGAWREQDNGKPIDASGTFQKQPYQTLPELVALLKRAPDVSACVVRDLYRYATAHEEEEGQMVHLDALTKAFDGGGRKLAPLVSALATSDAFRFAAR
jgi:hypothetical protein